MKIAFRTKELHCISVKTNGTIKESIDAYRKKHTPMSVFLTDYLAVKSKGNHLVKADNPWAYYYKGIEGHEIESGVSTDETLFRFAAMKLKDELPTDVISAAFYANQSRNDSDFEIGYLLPLFIENVTENDNALIINPTPEMILSFEKSNCACKKKNYAVTDETVAKLYQIQFPESSFLTFDELSTLKELDTVLFVNRDQDVLQSHKLLGFLSGCGADTKIIGLLPNVWFDNPVYNNRLDLENNGFSISQVLIVDPSATNSTPKKKLLITFEKGENDEIAVKNSSFDRKNMIFTVSDETVKIESEHYLKTDKTIMACWKEASNPARGKHKPVYKKPVEYQFSKEISLFYKVYSGRKNKFAGIAYYREIRSIEPKLWGKKCSPDIEKGLRASSEEDVKKSLESIPFDNKLYPIIWSDIEKKYIGNKPVTLKTLWFYCWNTIADSSKYDHDLMRRLFINPKAANIIPQIQSGEIILEALAETIGVPVEDIPFVYVDQLNCLFRTAMKLKLIMFNPLESYISEYSQRATERQQDVRNALVKKHFSEKEEEDIYRAIIGSHAVSGMLCTEKSLLLATGIRLFTGMSIREVAALKWCDFRPIAGTDNYQFFITKFVDQNGRIMLHAEKQNWKRFRIVPSAHVLTILLLARKRFLINSGISEEYLTDCPIVLSEERIADMRKMKRIGHCKPVAISKSGNELIKSAKIPENIIVLPDDQNDLATDFNRYHGDIFQTNFRDKANHSAFMTIGEINYILGIDAPDTFSRHYCDYSNDYIQIGIIQKLRRWETKYEQMINRSKLSLPSFGEQEGAFARKVGPYESGNASIDLVIENKSDSDAQVMLKSDHGLNVNLTIYED